MDLATAVSNPKTPMGSVNAYLRCNTKKSEETMGPLFGVSDIVKHVSCNNILDVSLSDDNMAADSPIEIHQAMSCSL